MSIRSSSAFWSRRWAIGGLAALVLAATPATATLEPRHLGTFKQWRAYAVEGSRDKHCFVYSEPTAKRGRYTRRGKVSIMLSHRPQDKVRNEVILNAGYTYQPNSQVQLVIDGKSFNLFVDAGSAWAPDARTDSLIRQALAKGSSMVVRGQSRRGTRTTDTYSLAGSGAALRRIDEECRAGAGG